MNLVLFCEKEMIIARIPFPQVSFRREVSIFPLCNSKSLAIFCERTQRGEQGSRRCCYKIGPIPCRTRERVSAGDLVNVVKGRAPKPDKEPRYEVKVPLSARRAINSLKCQISFMKILLLIQINMWAAQTIDFCSFIYIIKMQTSLIHF